MAGGSIGLYDRKGSAINCKGDRLHRRISQKNHFNPNLSRGFTLRQQPPRPSEIASSPPGWRNQPLQPYVSGLGPFPSQKPNLPL